MEANGGPALLGVKQSLKYIGSAYQTVALSYNSSITSTHFVFNI